MTSLHTWVHTIREEAAKNKDVDARDEHTRDGRPSPVHHRPHGAANREDDDADGERHVLRIRIETLIC